MLNRVLAEAFSGWKQHASERRQEQQIVVQVAQLPVRNLARRTWSIWWQAYQHQLKMRSTVQKLLHGTAIRVLHHWQVLTTHSLMLALTPSLTHALNHNLAHFSLTRSLVRWPHNTW